MTDYNKIKPIETEYDGYLFRSRTEARWAVYFNALGIKYEYEKEGYDLGGDLGWYLPDFWLPELCSWVEVKGDRFTPKEIDKCASLYRMAQPSGGFWALEGPPDCNWYKCIKHSCGQLTTYTISRPGGVFHIKINDEIIVPYAADEDTQIYYGCALNKLSNEDAFDSVYKSSTIWHLSLVQKKGQTAKEIAEAIHKSRRERFER